MTHAERLLAAAKRAMMKVYKELQMIWRMIQTGSDLQLTFEHFQHRYWAHCQAVAIAQRRVA